MSNGVEVAANGLLSRLCDVVVHLGEDLRITRPSPHLAALLLRPPDSGMMNISFLDFFSCGEESERTREFLLRDAPGVDTLHTSMRDSNAVVVAVRLFHVCGQGFDGQTLHVVGVRVDAGSLRMPLGPQPPHATPIATPLAEHTPSDVESVRALQLESCRDLVVYFKLFEAGYPVEKCSASFTLLSGPLARGTSLLEWIVSAESFIKCAQELRDSALREGQDLHLQRSVPVRLRPPHLHRLGRELSAEAVLSLLHNGTGAEAELWTARIELHDTKVVRKRGKSEKVQFRPPSKRAVPVESIDESSGEFDVIEEMDANFKVLEERYPVTACSPSFASFVGLPEVEIRMLDLVVDEEAFITQAQAVFNRVYHSGDFTVSQTCRNARLKLPRTSTKHRSHMFHARIELSMDHNSSTEHANEWTVKARLHDVLNVPRHDRPRGRLAQGLGGSCCRGAGEALRTCGPDSQIAALVAMDHSGKPAQLAASVTVDDRTVHEVLGS